MALAKSRLTKPKTFKYLSLPGKNEQVYQGGLACVDRATGLVAKAFAATTLMPIGKYTKDQLTTGNAPVLIELFDEIQAEWIKNAAGGDAVTAADLLGLCYLRDDETVGVDDDTNTLSVAGVVWGVDAVKGVLVQFRAPNGQATETGLDA
jgi:hypothetical protein